MTPPRRIRPGDTFFATRRCLGQQFLLIPVPAVKEICRYALALAAKTYGILLHGYCFMSNHLHLVATDPHGLFPKFMQMLASLIARAVNRRWRRKDHVFSCQKGSYVHIDPASEDPDHIDLIGKIAYTVVNPVAAGLVKSYKQWPGAIGFPEQIGRGAVAVRRPEGFFSEAMPEVVELELVPPPGIRGEEAIARFRERVLQAVAERQEEIRAAAKSQGWKFRGPEAAQRGNPTSAPRQEASFSIKPRVSASDTARLIEKIKEYERFIFEYRDALRRFCAGDREVVFPFGTYKMRVLFGVHCEGPPSAAG